MLADRATLTTSMKSLIRKINCESNNLNYCVVVIYNQVAQVKGVVYYGATKFTL